jgi:hypothetical protein
MSVRHVGGTVQLSEDGGTTTYAWSIFNPNASKYLRGSTSLPSFNEIYNFTGKAFEGEKYNIFLQCWRKNTVFNNYKVKIQLEKGSKVTDYESYYLNEGGNATLKFKNLNGEWIPVNIPDVIRYSEQSLTEEQKEQARTNIGIVLDNYYTKAQIDAMEYITTEDIDTICGGAISYADEVKF